jgi:hypothetical protein
LHVHVRVPGVAEDHAAHPAPRERRAHAAHVVGQPPRRHAPVLDELHAGQRRVEPGEDGAGGVAQLPEGVLGGRVERERHVPRAGRPQGVAQRRRGRGGGRGVARLHLGEQHRLGHPAARPAHRVRQRAAVGRHVEERAVQQLARGRAGVARPLRARRRVLQRRERGEHARRGAGRGGERQLHAHEQGERPLAPHQQVDQLARARPLGERVAGALLARGVRQRGARVQRRPHPRRDVGEQPARGRHVGRGRAAAHPRARPVGEHAVQPRDPGPHGPVAERVRAGGVGGGHPAHRGPRPARRVDGEAEAGRARGGVHGGAGRARAARDAPGRRVHRA